MRDLAWAAGGASLALVRFSDTWYCPPGDFLSPGATHSRVYTPIRRLHALARQRPSHSLHTPSPPSITKTHTLPRGVTPKPAPHTRSLQACRRAARHPESSAITVVKKILMPRSRSVFPNSHLISHPSASDKITTSLLELIYTDARITTKSQTPQPHNAQLLSPPREPG